MGKRTIQAGKRAAVQCRPGGHCYDGENRCVHCREHFGDGHQPDCPHVDGPVDECDARPADVDW
ncbi:hypothetical protein ACIBPB_27415 [Micromonospora sp. NPDC049836]|uniref:hypothetical protein n=1 Tax=Micromonospora sp. NPDC049836 TaxID=3364274 RepID=UPI00379FB950